MERCVCINIFEDNLVEKELDLGEIYELLIMIGKINLRKTKSFKNRFCKLMRLVPSSRWIGKEWKEWGHGNRMKARAREERPFSDSKSHTKVTEYIIKISLDERGTEDEVQMITNSLTLLQRSRQPHWRQWGSKNLERNLESSSLTGYWRLKPKKKKKKDT